MGSVRKRNEGYQIDYRTADGTRVREQVGRDKATAKMILAEREKRESQIAAGIIPSVTNDVRLSELRDEFEAWMPLHLRPGTVKRHRLSLGTILPRLPIDCAAHLRACHIDAYQRSRIDDGVSARTVNIELGTLKRMLRWAEERGRIGNNPLEKVRPLRQPDGPASPW